MSTSRHPIALRLERHVGGATRLLATVMGLPLVDGIFPALVIAGALTAPFGVIETGLLIFGGSATMAVVLAEMDGTPRERAQTVLLIGAVLVPVAAAEATLARTIESVIAFDVFRRFAGLVIVAVAAKTASAEVGEYLPRPGAIIGLGLLASVEPAGAELVFRLDPALMARAAAAAGIGVAFALAVAFGAPYLRGRVHLDRFRFGSSVALGMLAISVLGVMPTDKPVALGVLCVTAVFSYDPGAGEGAAEEVADDAGLAPGAASTDGGADSAAGVEDTPAAGIDPVDDDAEPGAGNAGADAPDDPSRAPWL